MDNNILSYLLKNFCLIYKLDDLILLDISYSSSSKIHIKKGNKEINKKGSVIKKKWDGRNVYFFHNEKDLGEIIKRKENGNITVNYDIIASSFYLLSGEQEISNSTKDEYDRFIYSNSIQERYDICKLPLVNYYFDILKTAIEIAYNLKIEFNHSSTATLTHDIDEVTSAWKHRARILFNSNKKAAGIVSIIKHFIKPFTPWKNLMDLNHFYTNNKINATFFFLTKNNKVGNIKNADYRIENSYIKNSIQELSANKHEIGIHGSYRTHDNPKVFIDECNEIPVKVEGGRFHFLQFDMNKTLETIQKSGLTYDTTLGFQEHIGFRNGICTPFYLYNFETKKAVDFIEIPLNIMDCTFAFEQYMNVSPDVALTKVNNLISEIKKFNGNVCVNWHNTFYSDYLYPEWKKTYQEIVVKLVAEGFIFLTCTELTKEYGDNN